MKHYLNEADAVLEQVQSAPEGLSESQAAKRLEANGKNRLAEGKKESLLHRFFKHHVPQTPFQQDFHLHPSSVEPLSILQYPAADYRPRQEPYQT
jgi:magnesium-transporting ATPase (P-type)